MLLNSLQENDLDINEFYDSIVNELKIRGWETKTQFLKNNNISPCQGCFECWVKIPGICKINDDAREILKEVMKSDLIIGLTKLNFGIYSSEYKNILDRFLPLVLPFFEKKKGEIFHQLRYEKYPSFIILGIVENSNYEKKELFRTLIHRNLMDLNSAIIETMIYEKGEDLIDFSNKFKAILTNVEVKL